MIINHNDNFYDLSYNLQSAHITGAFVHVQWDGVVVGTEDWKMAEAEGPAV